VLRQTRRFGKEIYKFSQIIRRGIFDSVDKEYVYTTKDSYIKRYLNFNEVPFDACQGTWYILGRVNSSVTELKMAAKNSGLYYADNKGNKSFDAKQWQAIKSWTNLSNGREITRDQAENMYKYIRELKDYDFRTPKFWQNVPENQMFTLKYLIDWVGLDLTEEHAKAPWWEILKRNFTPRQTNYFILLLKKYGQKKLNKEPNIIIDTIHSVKGGEANNVLIYSKTNWPASFSHKTKEEKSDEKRVYYTGVTRAKNTLHILSTDYKYNYPIGMDYLMYLQESA
jgi:hypothetical protein